jgi:hypothetical protein
MRLSKPGVLLFQGFQFAERRFPLPLKLSRDEAVFRLNALILSTGTVRFVA